EGIAEISLAEQHCETMQNFIAGPVPVSLVENLELVDVEHGEHERFATLISLFQRIGETLLIGIMVAQTGKWVGKRHTFEVNFFGLACIIKLPAVAPRHRHTDTDKQQTNHKENESRNKDRLL